MVDLKFDNPSAARADQLRARAREYREMAETARPAGLPAELIRLAERFEAMADRLKKEGKDANGS
jgi:hypothetical protein